MIYFLVYKFIIIISEKIYLIICDIQLDQVPKMANHL